MNRINQWLYRLGNALLGRRLNYLEDAVFSLRSRLDRNALLTGKQCALLVRNEASVRNLSDAEFSVFSRGGEDGIIQYLLGRVPIQEEFFVEFGVEDYRESNTRFLAIHDNWAGFVMEQSRACVEKLKTDPVYAQCEIRAEHAHVTRDNINDLLRNASCPTDTGLLSIDIDGNDYWIWDAIEAISPRIVICEYNSVFGAVDAVVIPYDPDFDRRKAHYSWLYFGASLSALCHLADRKGYVFAGCCKAGSNAFFVRKDVAGGVHALSAEDGYRLSREREGRTLEGGLSFVSGSARREVIGDLKVLDLDSDTLRCVKDLM